MIREVVEFLDRFSSGKWPWENVHCPKLGKAVGWNFDEDVVGFGNGDEEGYFKNMFRIAASSRCHVECSEKRLRLLATVTFNIPFYL